MGELDRNFQLNIIHGPVHVQNDRWLNLHQSSWATYMYTLSMFIILPPPHIFGRVLRDLQFPASSTLNSTTQTSCNKFLPNQIHQFNLITSLTTMLNTYYVHLFCKVPSLVLVVGRRLIFRFSPADNGCFGLGKDSDSDFWFSDFSLRGVTGWDLRCSLLDFTTKLQFLAWVLFWPLIEEEKLLLSFWTGSFWVCATGALDL